MRHVQRPPARARMPAPSVGPVHLAVRQAVRGWLERLDPSADPLATPHHPHPRRSEVNPMSTMRRLATRLLLLAAPAVLLVIETAGNRISP
jgi:hypothetical protein